MLLLDEPTNDLDVDTLRALEAGLESFPGCAVVISHDRWFLDRIATHVLAFEGDSQVRLVRGQLHRVRGVPAPGAGDRGRPAAPDPLQAAGELREGGAGLESNPALACARTPSDRCRIWWLSGGPGVDPGPPWPSLETLGVNDSRDGVCGTASWWRHEGAQAIGETGSSTGRLLPQVGNRPSQRARGPLELPCSADSTCPVGLDVARNVITVVLPDLEQVVAGIPEEFADEDELPARIRLAFLNTHVSAGAGDLDAAIGLLRARASGDLGRGSFGARIRAESFDALADAADQALAADGWTSRPSWRCSSSRATSQPPAGGRLILFLGLNAAVRRAVWEHGTAEIARQGLDHERYVELGRWLLLWTEMSSLATSEGYRAAERDILARDAAARRAAIDELLGAVPAEGRAAARLRRLAMRYGLDPDATYRLAAILPGPDADPTPDEPGIDEDDLQTMAGRIDQLLRRPAPRDGRPGAGAGIRVPFAITWRGTIVAVLGPDPREWQRLQEAVATVLGSASPSWTAIAVQAHGVPDLARSLLELQEGLRVADAIGRRGVIDDLAELGIERLLLGDRDSRPSSSSASSDRCSPTRGWARS